MNQILTLPKISTRKLLQASGSLDFRFEDLGLEIEGGFEAGSFNGTAEVTYWDDPSDLEWFVGDITLDCHKWDAINNRWLVKHIKLEPESKLYRDIWSVLTEGRSKDHIEARVMQDIEA